MPFKKILIALDGSKYSQIAAGYGFFLTKNLEAQLYVQHVVDPRFADLLIAPEFAQELGVSAAADISDKVIAALRKIGKLILKVVIIEAETRKLSVQTCIDEGHVVEEILKRAVDNDLVIMGYKGMGQHPVAAEMAVGSIAERVALGSKKPMLIAATPIETLKEILVAYDGSEPAKGALLMAEQLAKHTGLKLKAIMVVPDKSHSAEAELSIQQGKNLLRQKWTDEVFSIEEGTASKVLLARASKDHSLLVIGAYGYRNPEANVMGHTVSSVVRNSNCSLLIFR